MQGSLRTAELIQLRRPKARGRSLLVPRDSSQEQYLKLPRMWDDVQRSRSHATTRREGEVPSPKPREHSHGGGVDSGSDLDFLGSLATSVDTIVWATVDSGAATSCLPKEMCKNMESHSPMLLASQCQCMALAAPW